MKYRSLRNEHLKVRNECLERVSHRGYYIGDTEDPNSTKSQNIKTGLDSMIKMGRDNRENKGRPINYEKYRRVLAKKDRPRNKVKKITKISRRKLEENQRLEEMHTPIINGHRTRRSTLNIIKEVDE